MNARILVFLGGMLMPCDSSDGHRLFQVVRRDSSPSHQAPLHNFSLGFLEACLSNLQHSAQAEVDACNLVSCGFLRSAALWLCPPKAIPFKEASFPFAVALHARKFSSDFLSSLLPFFLMHNAFLFFAVLMLQLSNYFSFK